MAVPDSPLVAVQLAVMVYVVVLDWMNHDMVMAVAEGSDARVNTAVHAVVASVHAPDCVQPPRPVVLGV